MSQSSRDTQYDRIIEHVFFVHYAAGSTELTFEREELVQGAELLGLPRPRNLGDIPYTYRYRRALPVAVRSTAPEGREWIILPAGRPLYRFVARLPFQIAPHPAMAETKVPDATPGIVSKYALSDEQALLAKLRYNRLIDIFTGITCYSLQSHLRTTVPQMGQVETDEMYLGLDRRGMHYVLPVQAKGGGDRLSVVQIEQDLRMCAHKFPDLVCRAIAAQFMGPDLIALFEFEQGEDGVVLVAEKHYRLVSPDQVTPEDLALYRSRGEQ